MLKFTMSNNRVSVDPVSLTLEPLRQIWMGDKSKIKEEATKLLTYIHIVSQIDEDAPFSKIDPSEVVPLAKKEIFGDYNYKFSGDFDEAFMEDALTSYQLAYETAEEAAVRAFDKKIHQMRQKIDKEEIVIEETIVRGTKTFVTNFNILNKMMQDMTKIVKARDELKASIVRGNTRGDTKGQRKLSYIEKRRRDMEKSKLEAPLTEEQLEEENF
jgi:hypothetical protein